MKNLFLPLLFVLTLFACDKDDDDKDLKTEAPVNYEFVRDGQSTVSFSGQTTRIKMATELISAMGDSDKTAEQAIEMYANKTADGQDADPYSDPELNASTKSVKSKVAASKDFFDGQTALSSEIREEIQNWIAAQYSEVFANKDELAEAGKAGQIADGSKVRYINAQGLEYNQAVNKSLIGALMVDQICNNYLSDAVLDAGDNRSENNSETTVEGKPYTTMEHKWDEAYGYLFGLAEDPAKPLNSLGNDKFLNKYLARVNDDSDFEGIAQRIYDAFKLGRAAIVNEDYELRDEQVEILREEISKVIAVRAVHYLQDGLAEYKANNYGSAFHGLSEGIGFIYSLQFTRKKNSDEPYFTRNEVETFITSLLSGNGFWDLDEVNVNQISESIANEFDFTVEEAAK